MQTRQILPGDDFATIVRDDWRVAFDVERLTSFLAHARRLDRYASKAGQLSCCRPYWERLQGYLAGARFAELDVIAATIAEVEGQLALLKSRHDHDQAVLKTWQRLPLERQCQELDVPLELVSMPYGTGGWIVDGVTYASVEHAALAMYRGRGYTGVAVEGRAVLMLIHAALAPFVAANPPSHHLYSDRDWFDRTSLEGVAHHAMHERVADLPGAIAKASRDDVASALAKIVPHAHGVYLDADVTVATLLTLWDAIGVRRITQLAEIVVKDAFYFRAGWPDLTLVRDDDLRFVEVKTTDKLHSSQYDIIREVLQPCGANVSVLRIKRLGRISL
jgi:hypothetical protein